PADTARVSGRPVLPRSPPPRRKSGVPRRFAPRHAEDSQPRLSPPHRRLNHAICTAPFHIASLVPPDAVEEIKNGARRKRLRARWGGGKNPLSDERSKSPSSQLGRRGRIASGGCRSTRAQGRREEAYSCTPHDRRTEHVARCALLTRSA